MIAVSRHFGLRLRADLEGRAVEISGRFTVTASGDAAAALMVMDAAEVTRGALEVVTQSVGESVAVDMEISDQEA